MGKSFAQVDATERRLMHSMRKAALTWEKIKEITGRSFDTLQNVFAQKCPPPRASPMKTIAPKGVKKDREHLKFKKADIKVKVSIFGKGRRISEPRLKGNGRV